MTYDVTKLPDFYSVRDFEQLDYSFENMENSKCLCFFDNGFTSQIIEPNKRDIKFIWDGFLLFVDKETTLDNLKQQISLYNNRLVALQRTNRLGKKFNNEEIRNYIISKLKEKNIAFEIMPDFNEVNGYPSQTDLWSTRDFSVLLDAIDCVGVGNAYFYKTADFKFEILFKQSGIPSFVYSHNGAIVLHGENSTAISRLIFNNEELKTILEQNFGEDKIFSYVEGKNILGKTIEEVKNGLRK